MTEWVVEWDWSKVAVGDRVRVERENGDLAELEVFEVAVSGNWVADRIGWLYYSTSWTLYVAPKPTPALPTEPGIYVCLGGSTWEQVPLFLGLGGWWLFADGTPAEETAKHWHAGVGLTRLESQADTARKFWERLDAEFPDAPVSTLSKMRHIAAELGWVIR